MFYLGMKSNAIYSFYSLKRSLVIMSVIFRQADWKRKLKVRKPSVLRDITFISYLDLMLTLLRRIRKSLLKSLSVHEGATGETGGSARNYILYAIGEILLIMIGILLALQVNNWNEHRKTNKQLSESLLKLSFDLQINLDHGVCSRKRITLLFICSPKLIQRND